ncbi:hypothetical protein U3516DRAFT_583185 [Neocallimastix sp. 'constans']
MFKKLFSRKKSSRCEICKKKIKNLDKNDIQKQCKECLKKKKSNQNLNEKTEINNVGNFGNNIKKILKLSNNGNHKESQKVIDNKDSNSLNVPNCYGCKWPIIFKTDIFEENNVLWHNSCYEIKKYLGINLSLENYNNIISNKDKLCKLWSECILKLSKILIAYLCDCNYYAFEIVSCIKNKDFNSEKLKELVNNIIQLIYFLISTSNEYIIDVREKKISQNELNELFKNIIIFRDSVEKDIIYTINVKKLMKCLSQIHETIKKELNNNINLVIISDKTSEFHQTLKFINKFENFGFKPPFNLTPIYNFKNENCHYKEIWDLVNKTENRNENYDNEEKIEMNAYLQKQITNEMNYLNENSEIIKLIYLSKDGKKSKINNNDTTTTNTTNENKCINELNENNKIKIENSLNTNDESNKSNTEVNNNINISLSGSGSGSGSYKTLYENGNENVKIIKQVNIINKESTDKIQNENENENISKNEINPLSTLYNSTKIGENDFNSHDFNRLKSSIDEILLKNERSFENKIGIKRIHKKKEEEEEQNHNSHLKSKKSNSMYNNKNDIIIDKDQGHSEYARSFYSLNNIKYSYVKPSNSNSTANNLDIYERAASPSYSMGKLDSNQNQQKSVDSSMDNQSFQLLYPYKDFYPLSLSHSSYSTKINGLSSSTTFNNDNNKNINDGSHTNNNGINENNLSMVSNSSVDIIKALSSSLKKGYFSSEAYLKYKKSSHNRNEGNSKKINDLHIYNLQTRTNGKDRSYYDNTSTGINSEYINDSGNDGTMPTIKLLNLQLQREREMKKAEEIVDESFERRPQYNHSVNDIKNGILKIRSILNSNSNNVNTKDFNLNSYNVITANTPINSLSNSHRKHHSLNMNSDHYNKTYNLSKDLIYFNKKLNEYNNQKKKYFNDNSSYSSDNNSDVNVFRTNIINFSQNKITIKGILTLPHQSNKRSSLILPSKEELNIKKNKDERNEHKLSTKEHSKNRQDSLVQQYKEIAMKINRNRDISELSSSLKKKQKEVKKYYNKQRIDHLIYDSVKKFGRDEKIANQWIAQLNRQEIFTVGDLRVLCEEDWYHLGLSVIAIRAIKDQLYYSN